MKLRDFQSSLYIPVMHLIIHMIREAKRVRERE